MHRVKVVDTRVAGEEIRVVPLALSRPDLTTADDLLRDLRSNHDALRRFFIEPPHGHRGLSAVLMFSPRSEDCARTVIIAPQVGYVGLAGTPLFSAVAALAEMREISFRTNTPMTVQLDTPRGPQKVCVTRSGPSAYACTWRTTPPKRLGQNVPCALVDGGHFSADILSTGLPYGVVRASDLGVDLHATDTLAEMAPQIEAAIRKAVPLESLGLSQDASQYYLQIIGRPSETKEPGVIELVAACVSHTGIVAQTPAGTGTLAAIASVTAHDPSLSGASLRVSSPSGHSLMGRINTAEAVVTGLVEVTRTWVLDVPESLYRPHQG